ncbi:MAG TPA: hypothetical protein VMT89_07600 [Candidatus Acidoferrales bacterium]|nr:hypothetical protein [Candidatus Acidoferrales bacterium]
MSMHSYGGFESHPFIYPHSKSTAISGHSYEHGFDAAVKIYLRGSTLTYSNTFKLNENPPFSTAGAARRASLEFAKGIIDQRGGENWMPSWQRRRLVHHPDRYGGTADMQSAYVQNNSTRQI